MKKLLLSAAALAILVSPTMAADIAVRAPVTKAPALVAPAAYNWTGFYSASSIGGAWWNIDGTYIAPPPDQHNTSGSRAIYGSSYGAQIQWNSWVFGVEGTYNTILNSDYTTSLSPGVDCLGASAIASRSCQSRIRNFWQAGARIGYAWNNWMAYATGGYANGRIQTQVLTTTAPTLVTSFTSERHGGWYAGGGVEVFVGRWFWSDTILGLEYQHVQFDTERHVDLLGVAANTRDVDATMDIVRARLTFKFTPGGAITAAY
jgi:outer membrane immunogenic protein